MALNYSDKLAKVTDLKYNNGKPVGCQFILGLRSEVDSNANKASLLSLNLISNTLIGNNTSGSQQLVAIRGLSYNAQMIRSQYNQVGDPGIKGNQGYMGFAGYRGRSMSQTSTNGLIINSDKIKGPSEVDTSGTGWILPKILTEIGFDISSWGAYKDLTTQSYTRYTSTIYYKMYTLVNTVHVSGSYYHD